MSNLLKFEIKLDDELRKLDIESDLNIATADISNELVQQPAKYAYYASLAEFAHKRVSEIENELNLLYSQLYKQVTTVEEKPEEKDTKVKKEKLTETAIRNIIINKKAYQAMLTQQVEMEYIYNILKVAKQAFEQRCQMLIQLGSISRQQMESAVIQIKKDMQNKIGR